MCVRSANWGPLNARHAADRAADHLGPLPARTPPPPPPPANCVRAVFCFNIADTSVLILSCVLTLNVLHPTRAKSEIRPDHAGSARIQRLRRWPRAESDLAGR